VLDVDRVFEVMGGEFEVSGLAEPRLSFFDADLQVLARLLATSQDQMPSFNLFGDRVARMMIWSTDFASRWEICSSSGEMLGGNLPHR
jgi:hypothetical protein